MRLTGKVAVVTGGASGMGAGHARRLAEEGSAVAITDIAAEAGEALARELRDEGHEASFHHHDVADPAAWQRVVSDVEDAHGIVTVLVNNAGVQVRSTGIEADDREWDLVTSVNQRGVFYGMRAVIPGMVAAGGGSIVNVASVLALVGMQGSIPYQASKAAVLGLSRGAALSYGPDNVRVNVVCPGFVITGITVSASEEAVAGMTERIPLGRAGQVEEVSAAVVFLASDEASYVTGAVLPVDGGYVVP